MSFFDSLKARLGRPPIVEPDTGPTAEIIYLPVSLAGQVEALRPYRRRYIPAEGEYATAAAISAFTAMRAIFDVSEARAVATLRDE